MFSLIINIRRGASQIIAGAISIYFFKLSDEEQLSAMFLITFIDGAGDSYTL